MGYLVAHLNLILNRTTFSNPNECKRGDIYELRYKSDTAVKSRYIIMALNVYKRKAAGTDFLLHALDLDEIPVIKIKKLLGTSDGVETRVDEKMEHQRMVITGRNTAYYNKEVKKLQKLLPGIYKTFSIDKITRIELCNYNFIKIMDSSMKKKFGIVDED
jgi:hypothetical protein